MNNNLMDFLIEYLSYCFDNDSELSDSTIYVNEGYDCNNEIELPQVAIQLLDNSEVERLSSFEAENVSSFGLQLNVFAENMTINGEVYTAQRACSYIADKIKLFMNDLKFKHLNENIVRLVRVGRDYTSPLDVNSGQVYVTVLRFDTQTIYPYLTELENIEKEN